MLLTHCPTTNPFTPPSPFEAEPNLLPPTRRTILLVDPDRRCGAVESAAAHLGAVCKTVSDGFLLGDQAVAADLLWVRAADDMDLSDLIAAIRMQVEHEHLSIVVHCSLERLDVLEAEFGTSPLVSLILDDDFGQVMAVLASRLRPTGGSVHAPSAMAEARDRQIETLQDEVSRISRMLARLAMDPAASREPPSPFIDDHVSAAARAYHAGPASTYDGPTVSARDVRQIIRQRRMRDEIFDSELFADPAWDMLLDLYAARLDRVRVSVSSLCIAAAVPATTALRWIKTLTETGLFERKADQHDARRIFVQLSDDATTAMHRYFARLADPRLAV